MIKKELCLQKIRSFRAKQGLDSSDENIIATIHLMNSHGIDRNASLDQSSRSGNDHGIDAWYYDDTKNELLIYQSKLSESKSLVLRGLSDLDSARQWIEQVIIEGTVDVVPNDNQCLYNLYINLGKNRGKLRKVTFILLSLFNRNELEDSDDFSSFENILIKSNLNIHIRNILDGKLGLDAFEFNLDPTVPEKTKIYPINKIPNSQIDLRHNAHLDLAYIPLYSLVELYRQRGDILFDKNVRLSLMNNKEAKERLVHPMDETLDLITSGKISPNIFPFYHIGVTIAASASSSDSINLLNLEAPSIINGCQTITISNEYLKRLEKSQNNDAIEKFKQIKVIAKVVVGTSNDELKEITNSNNRQNPIDNWQLFSNEPIHIEIETTLKDLGVFYERQKGKFDTVMKNADYAKYFQKTNGVCLRIVDVGQAIALSRQNLQWAAKPSEIFVNKENHDVIFDKSIPKFPQDIIFTSNMMKALKRGLNKYLDIPTHANSYAPKIFNKPIIRNQVYHLALLHFYQTDNKWSFREEFSKSLTKIANPRLVEESQSFYMKVVSKIRNWYTDESKSLTIEISKRRTDAFFISLATEIGVDLDGSRPFTENSVDWREYERDN